MSELAGPLAVFRVWLDEARQTEGAWSDELALATATTNGRPSVRSVMLRGLDDEGLVFFTDEGSRKGRELADNPVAAAAFTWPERRRQVRLEGPVARLAEAAADALFMARPPERRLPLWAWRQDEVVADEADLRRRLDRARQELSAGAPGRPPYWAGYRLRPEVIEFWEERALGLHERVRHLKHETGWTVQLLAP